MTISQLVRGVAAAATVAGLLSTAATPAEAAGAVPEKATLREAPRHEPPTGAPASPRPRPQHLTDAQRKLLIDATHRFRDVRKAIKAGYLPTEDCVPGMGLHYANPARTSATRIDPAKPPILLYALDKHGKPQLTGLEYFHPDADGDLHTDRDRPNLFGHPFDGPMEGHHVPPGAPPMPVHYDLHVWLYLQNPNGELATLNPKITC
ncbi:hypothetical protein BJY16_004383 [Actinoplanes octamycinicus]|uniref:Uncharacterized protein n=1 Tax=Actinoplanes octamycinicus TaxID=135948 RepID=A0A7W7GZ34_9ACTN|nr:hypothetical protein [Actinoplanes octamycinicus]MBB4740924.1 hypothetical protein [Actinoplanes octamycinicus]GIE55831.1 hypothetical protein Aoc01nite_12330 [Actinoplanes octamycinicus]